MTQEKKELLSKKHPHLSSLIVGGTSGLIAGTLFGIVSEHDKITNELAGQEYFINGVTAIAGLASSWNDKPLDKLIDIGAMNLTYRIAYFGTKMIYQMFK